MYVWEFERKKNSWENLYCKLQLVMRSCDKWSWFFIAGGCLWSMDICIIVMRLNNCFKHPAGLFLHYCAHILWMCFTVWSEWVNEYPWYCQLNNGQTFENIYIFTCINFTILLKKKWCFWKKKWCFWL